MRADAGVALLIAGGILAACSTNGVTTTRYEGVGDTTALYVQTSAAYGTNGVAVRNSPYPAETIMPAVLSALQARYQGGQYRFGIGTPPGWNGYTVIIGFGRPPVGGQNLCQNSSLPQAPSPPGVIEITAAYCYGNRIVTEAIGRAPASGPDDPRFRQLIGQAVAELFTNEPQRYPDPGRGLFVIR